MLKEKPTFLQVSSFIFYYPSSLIGPSFEFTDFMRFIRLEKEFENINWKGVNKHSFIQFIHGIIYAVVLVVGGQRYTTQYCGTEEFENSSLLYKFLYFNFSIAVLRSKYYVGWKLSQSSVIFCGLGYNISYDEKGNKIETYNRVENINITKIETDINPQSRIYYWNRTVHLWLKYYLFLRLINVERKPFKNNKALVTFVTFMVSAFWHGFYPVYFFFFFEYYMIEHISKYLDEEYDLFNKMENSSFIPKTIFRILVCSVINYFGLCFTLLTIRANFIFSRAFYFVPFMSLFGGYLYVVLIRIHSNKKRKANSHGEKKKTQDAEILDGKKTSEEVKKD
jgi:lysophospholipid acyltransferase